MCVDHEVRAQRIGCVFQFTRPSPVRREERRCDTALQGCGCCSAANATSPTCGGQVRSVQGALSCGELPKAHVPCCPSVPWLFVFSVRGGGRCGRLRRYTLCCVLGECVALLTSGFAAPVLEVAWPVHRPPLASVRPGRCRRLLSHLPMRRRHCQQQLAKTRCLWRRPLQSNHRWKRPRPL